MSFLQELQNRKKSLHISDTVVTCVDGTRYIERHSSSSNISIVPQKSTIGFIIDTAPDDVPALVVPYIFVGSQDCCDPDILSKHSISLVLSIGVEALQRHPDVTYKHVACLDLPETNLTQILAECNQIIKKAEIDRQNTLVHCNAGVSRSVSVVIGYLMLEKHKTYDEAYNLVKSVRPCIQPNAGFVKQLKQLI